MSSEVSPPRRPANEPNPMPGYVPVPESSITCGLDDALPSMVTVPDFAPCVVGEKVTLMLQVLPAATLPPHVEVISNWPVAFIAEIFSAVLPVLVSLIRPAACAGCANRLLVKVQRRVGSKGYSAGIEKSYDGVAQIVRQYNILPAIAVEIPDSGRSRMAASRKANRFLKRAIAVAIKNVQRRRVHASQDDEVLLAVAVKIRRYNVGGE